jgi:DnaJ family protein C protein 17
MSSDEPNAYELLELTIEATEADIRRAYRQRSLKLHPDKVCPFASRWRETHAELTAAFRTRITLMHVRALVSNICEKLLKRRLARLFHELRQGYELLLDPLRRMALDAKMRLAAAKKERYKSYDVKRKAMFADLEEREAAFKRNRAEKDQKERTRWTENERIKEEGRKMREARQKRTLETEDISPKPDAEVEELSEDEPPELGKHSR